MVKFGLVASLVVRLALLNCFLGRYVAEGDTVAPPSPTSLPSSVCLLLLQRLPSLSVLTHHRFLIRFHSLWVFRGVLHCPRRLLFRSFIVIGDTMSMAGVAGSRALHR